MTLQELDLKVEYQPGRTIAPADALSQYSISLLATDCTSTQTATVVANATTSGSDVESREVEELNKC